MQHLNTLPHWPKILTRLRKDFPEMTVKIGADTWRDIALQLSKGHDLTQSEAVETLQDWFWRNAPNTARHIWGPHHIAQSKPVM